MKFGSGAGPSISHISFADDLVLIAEASLDQAQLIQGVLADFCASSGQKISLHKSKVFFSKNLSNDVAANLSSVLGINRPDDLGVYLGAPLLHQRASKHSSSFIIEKMKKKLSGWKASSLSFTARVTLAQTPLSSIPGYVIQACAILVSICDEAERLCRNFIWGS